MTRLLTNPFFVYIISFGIVLVVYSLGWSRFYPNLSEYLLIFFAATFFISFFFGVVIQIVKPVQYREISWNDRTKIYLIIVWIGYILEFIYNKGIPFQMLLQGTEYDYRVFGIPTFHVFLVTFSSFLSVYIFHQMCSHFNKKRLLFFFVSILPPILIINRGMMVIILTSCLFVYLMSLRTINIKAFIGMLFLILVAFYLFGIMGNFRQTKGATTTSEIIIELSQAPESFKQSIIPDEYIWSYLYISSPLANLQTTINKASVSEYSFSGFFNFELLPDFISKRTAAFFELKRKHPILVQGWLSVATVYAPAYVYLNWIGIILMFCFFLTTTLIYILILKRSSTYYVTGLAILNTLVLFNTFDNMYYFSGINLQLIYPIVLSMMSSVDIKQILTAVATK